MGLQILTSGGDGLLKLWEVRSGECTATFEEQEGKVWALTSSGEQDKWVASGGADSLVNIWEDASQEKLEEADAAKALEVDLQQEFSNALQVHNLSSCFSSYWSNYTLKLLIKLSGHSTDSNHIFLLNLMLSGQLSRVFICPKY